MALKVVNTESLDAVANAINAKSGTSGALQFPEGFVDAIGAIQAGGGEDLSTALTEQEELVAELKGIIAQKAKLGDAKLPSIIERTVTEITAEDLAGVTRIGNYAFYNYELGVSIDIPESVTYIGKGAFQNSSFTTINIPNVKLRIVSYALEGAKVKELTLFKNWETDLYAFNSMSSLEKLIVEEGITHLMIRVFYNASKLTSVTLPESLTSIGEFAFGNCNSLPFIVIPKNVTKIDGSAFRYGYKLEYVDLTAYGTDGAFPTLGSVYSFGDCGKNTPSGTFEIRVKSGRKAELAAMTNWSTYADNIVEV